MQFGSSSPEPAQVWRAFRWPGLTKLTHFYPKLYSLPGGDEPNRELRWSIAVLLRDFPASLRDPMASLREFFEEHTRSSHKRLYEGDLETDFLRLLAELHRSAKEKPVPVVVDFRLASRRQGKVLPL